MMKHFDEYETVIGLEVHVELDTETKIFCGCKTTFGAAPNTQVCPVCLGFPGTLPVLNEKVVEYAVKAGLALGCEITSIGRQDRKNYFYPDLPKAYQISQSDLPICTKGALEIETNEGKKKIGITRIHIEEDAGKLIHDGSEGTMIDYNRGGVPLIEIVSEPDLRSAEEVKAYLQKLRATLLYHGISSCKMNEGAFRCDVNLSVRKKGATEFGIRTEMKNLNSFSFITKAIENERVRQMKIVSTGGEVNQETRRWDAAKGQSTAMRSKEDAHDYRYFPDPDLMPIVVSEETLRMLKQGMPTLPEDYKRLFVEKFGLKPSVAEQIITSKAVADFFVSCLENTSFHELLGNLTVTEIFRLMSTEEEESALKMDARGFCDLVNLLGEGRITLGIAKKVLTMMWQSGTAAFEIIEAENLWPIIDLDVLMAHGARIMEKMPQIKADYQSGKTQALGAFMGQMMKLTGGKADPAKSEEAFLKLISK